MNPLLSLVRVLIVTFAIALLAGCAASKVAEGRSGVDLSPIVPGSTRAQTEAILGPPVREWTTSVGIRYALYRYDAGVPPDPDMAVLTGIVDVGLLGALSAATALDEHGGLGPPRYALLALSYGTNDRVLGVFEDVTEFTAFPEDGRATPGGNK